MKEKQYSWIKLGLFWGFFMFVIMGIVVPWHEGGLTSTELWKHVFIWLIGGLVYGYLMEATGVLTSNKKEVN